MTSIFGLFAYFQFSENPIKTSDNKATKEPINVSDYTPEENEKYDLEDQEFERKLFELSDAWITNNKYDELLFNKLDGVEQ